MFVPSAIVEDASNKNKYSILLNSLAGYTSFGLTVPIVSFQQSLTVIGFKSGMKDTNPWNKSYSTEDLSSLTLGLWIVLCLYKT